MISYSLHNISLILNAKISGNPHVEVNSVAIDSRVVSLTSNTLFFAIVGEHHDGHRFIGELHSKGVAAFVVSRIDSYATEFPTASFLLVNDTLKALQQLAAHHRSCYKYPVIGITGSNGKTVVKEWLAQLLEGSVRVVRSPKSYNSQVGVPLSVLQMSDNFDLGIFEAGISKTQEMDNLQAIINPTIGVYTNIGSAHQDNFIDLQSKAREKIKLFAASKVLIFCRDHSIINLLAHETAIKTGINLYSWGSDPDANIQLVSKTIINSRTKLTVQHHWNFFEFTIPFADEASIENAMHCLCVMLYLGIDWDLILHRMSELHPVAMRLELKEGVNGCTIINDTYNSDIGSLSIALDYLAQQRQHNFKILILSDILQSGRSSKSLYEEVSMLVASKGVNQLIGIGEEISSFSALFQANSIFFRTTQDFIDGFERKNYRNFAILVKGSRPFAFERISNLLEQKTHRTVLEINLNALVHNLNYFRGLLKPNVKIMVMVKAFSYGAGSYEIANLLQYHRVDYLGVAFADEGIALREAGITLPIVVLNPAFGSYELMIEYNLEPEIFSPSSLDSFSLALSKRNVSSYPIHIKIDTGMHRLGFANNEIEVLCQRLNDFPSIKVESIFSHLVATDDSYHDDFTNQQIETFQNVCNSIVDKIGYKPMMHIVNSAGIERFSSAQFDMVRLGIGLYGVSAVHQQNVQIVSTLKTFIAQLHNVPKGETVGYNRKGMVYKPSVVATLPIGYADGLNRKLSNGVGTVLVKGKIAPIIGNISMDTCMVDVTDIGKVDEGDEVIIFGEKPSVIEIAQSIETIPYEVLTSISRRVKRVYVQE
jgi:alanine racemase